MRDAPALAWHRTALDRAETDCGRYTVLRARRGEGVIYLAWRGRTTPSRTAELLGSFPTGDEAKTHCEEDCHAQVGSPQGWEPQRDRRRVQSGGRERHRDAQAWR